MHLRNIILEMIAKGEPLEATTDELCLGIEAALPGVRCTVLKMERSGLLLPLSAPGFPKPFIFGHEGIMIGPNVGSCGSAAYLGRPVLAVDIGTDPRWVDYRQAPLSLGLHACWSSPVISAAGNVLGTFAFYFHEKRGPTADEEVIVKACTYLCALALEMHNRIMERERRANLDALTDLPNRASFDAALARLPTTEAGSWALLLIDLDNLKMVNDTFGHQAGDALLQIVASRISCVTSPDRVFRIGGDEFAVVVQSLSGGSDLKCIARNVLATLSMQADCCGHIVIPRATIGGAIQSEGLTARDVYRHADLALYHGKEKFRGDFSLYQPELRTTITDRVRTISDVELALRENRIEAYYQPIVRLDTRQIIGVEALCRLERPDGTIASAAEFLAATADARTASALTERMLSIVAADVRSWLDQGIPFQHAGVNISSIDFHSAGLYERIQVAFAKERVPLSHVVVEVTESVYLGQHDPAAVREIGALRERGLRVALDDFGTGFASLTHLLTVPVDIIKLDKTFIDHLDPSHPSAAIVEGLIGIATKLGIKVVSEGIEREHQAAQLLGYGCLLGQGYLFSQAVSRSVATTLLLNFSQKGEMRLRPVVASQ